MIVKDEAISFRGGAIGAAVLLTGIAIGFLAKPETWKQDPPATVARTDSRVNNRLPDPADSPMKRAERAPAEKDNGLLTLYIDLKPKAAAQLQAARDRAYARGQIVQEAGDLVPATVRLGDKVVAANVRLKGDSMVHLVDDKWSLRIELKDDKLFGMSRMSIQNPVARGHLWEWLILETARRDGLIAPRATFVNVVVNNNSTGVFYLEEHFTKELLESQGRRDGPIVRFVENSFWNELLQYRNHQGGIGIQSPATSEPSRYVTAAEISAYGEKRLAQSESLARQLAQAIYQMRTIQLRMMSQKWISAGELAKVESEVLSEGRTMDRVLDTRSAADMHAMLCLFRSHHGLYWINRRFYHNPITDRLEPVVYDVYETGLLTSPDPIEMATVMALEFLKSPTYYNRLFERLGELSDPEYLNTLFRDLEPQLRQYAKVLLAEGFISPEADVDVIMSQLWDQQVYIREMLRPTDGVNFDCQLMSDDPIGGGTSGMLEIQAWATTRVPVVLKGFRFGNDRFVRARQSIANQNPAVSFIDTDRNAVVLPNDGRHVLFRFPVDGRLAGLHDVRAIKKAMRSGSKKDVGVKLSLQAEYKYIGNQAERVEQLSIRRFGSGWEEEGTMPESPALEDALAKHAFLSHDPDHDVLSVRAGEWEVDGDLAVPRGQTLRIGPGVTLRFDAGAAIIATDGLLFEGTGEDPILLEPKSGVLTWAGVVVVNATSRSHWRHVSIRDTDVVTRGGWVLTGGITFYRSPVDMYDCTIRNAHGEDALNIYDTDFLLERVTIDGVASDAFDGDFVTGMVRSCTFLNSVEDAVDVSGSDVQVIDCRFVDIGDKSISAGENSTVRVRGGVVESASIAIASKDSSHVDVSDLSVWQIENYVLAAYIKKPEYGPSSIVAQDLDVVQAGRGMYLVQDPCELTLDGVSIAGTEVDVDDLYKKKILGK